MTDDSRLVVGRLRKPHGLKGDLTLFPITDDAEMVFAPGRSVWLVGLDGETVAGPVTIERSRGYHREWLVKFAGADRREDVEPWRGLFLAVPAEELAPPEDDEVYLHELDGFAVRLPDQTPLGLVTFRRAIHGVARRSQASLDELRDCRLVFDDKDPHAADSKRPRLAPA